MLVGVGILGTAIARRHTSIGRPLTVYNRTSASARRVVSPYVRHAESLSEFGRGSLVYMCVSDANALRSILPSLLYGGEVPSMIANLTTIGPVQSKIIRALVQQAGVIYAECPVTGGPESAELGELTCYFSSDKEVLEGLKFHLEVFCKSIHWVGETHEAQSVKVINNLMETINMWGAAEALALAESVGLSISRVSHALMCGRGSSTYLGVLLQGIASGFWSENPRVTMGIRAKDVFLAQEMISDSVIAAPLTNLVASRTQEALHEFGSFVDQTRCFEFQIRTSVGKPHTADLSVGTDKSGPEELTESDTKSALQNER